LGIRSWPVALIAGGKERTSLAKLANAVRAGRLLRFVLGFLNSWQKHGSENGDDGDDDEQFDEGEVLLHGDSFIFVQTVDPSTTLHREYDAFGLKRYNQSFRQA
jgi:hypothetical protein